MSIWSRSTPTTKLFALTGLVLVVGVATTLLGGPCNGVGAWTALAALVPSLAACAILLVAVLKQRTAGAIIILVAGLLATGMVFILGFGSAMLMCRGV